MSSHTDRRAARDAADRQSPNDAALHAMCLRLAASYRRRLACGERQCLAERHAWALRRAREIRLRLARDSAAPTAATAGRPMSSRNPFSAAGAPPSPRQVPSQAATVAA